MKNRIGALAAAGIVLAAACAKPLSPPGGETDRLPPRLLTSTPETSAVVPGFDGAVVFAFDERVSERGVEDLVIVSPETGAVEVEKGRREVKVSLAGGWRPNTIYRVALQSGVADLFGNRTDRPIEVVFSTGPQVPETAVAGMVKDRITGKPAAGARVEALYLPDSLVYVAVADTGGFYALRRIPAGDYRLRAYVDQVPNRTVDFVEPVDTASASLGAADTLVAKALELVPADTTPANVVRAEAKDSMAVTVSLDDYIDPETQGLFGTTATLWQLPVDSAGDSVRVQVAAVLFPDQLEERRRMERAARDTTRAESAGADPRPAETEKDREILPVREIVVIPMQPLLPDTRYRMVVEGLPNIAGLQGGGGAAPFRTAPPPKKKEEPGQAPAAAPPDTTGGR